MLTLLVNLTCLYSDFENEILEKIVFDLPNYP